MNKRWKLALICAAPIWSMAIYCLMVAEADVRFTASGALAFVGVLLALIIGFSKAHTRDD